MRQEVCWLLFRETYLLYLATVTGFEPIPTESKSVMLPLHHTATQTRLDVSWHLITKGECICLRDRTAVIPKGLPYFRIVKRLGKNYCKGSPFYDGATAIPINTSVLAVAGLEPATSNALNTVPSH